MKPIGFDPRLKLLLLLLTIFSASLSPSLYYEAGLILLLFLFGILNGRVHYSLASLIAFGCIFALTLFTKNSLSGTLRTMLIAFLGLVHKVYPCGMLAGIIIGSTGISEFMAALQRIHISKKLVIPLAVLLRYLPVIQEDWKYIKDAMGMRDVSPSLKGLLTRPSLTVESLYVPLMMSASRAADELSIASITRGIENPAPRTCLTRIRFKAPDYVTAALFLLYLLYGIQAH